MTLPSHLDPRSSWPGFLLAAAVVLTVLFTLLQPGISDGLSGIWLILFWAAHVILPLGLLQGAQIALSRVVRVAALNPWLQTALSGLAGSALFAPVALGLDKAFGLADVTDDAGVPLPTALLDEFTGLVPIVTLVWLGLNATRLLRLEAPAPRGQTKPVTGPATGAMTPADLWAGVPRGIGRDLVALTAELHYLRVRTTGGESLVLYPFGKAIADLAATGAGLQIHRSHWVALSHVRQVDRRGQGAVCTLSTGLLLPVSRQHRAALLAAFDTAKGAPASLRA